MTWEGEDVAGVIHPDGAVDVPVTAAGPGVFGDGVTTLRPGDAGYDQAAATAIPAEQHPLLQPHDRARAAALEAMFAAREHLRSA